MNKVDIERLGFTVGEHVEVLTVARDATEVPRVVEGLRVTEYDIPLGCAAGYFPECNPLVPLWHHAAESFVPAAKSIPVRLRRSP
jgi:anaerobic selenocysteine-containing dehydrogenase